MEVVKKIFKVIGKILLVLLILLIICIIGIFIYHRIMISKNKEFLKEKGYYNPVSVGDYSLNVQKTGNENGDHRIVILSGAGPCYRLFMKDYASYLQDEDQVIFLSRAGYDASDDSKKDMTVENVVEDYRKALENAGVQKPYLLMPHSLGSIYASYWVSKYPDEIEAMVNLDGSSPKPIDSPEEGPGKDLIYYLANLGVGDVAFHAFIPRDPDYTADEQRAFDIMYTSTLASSSIYEEGKYFERNINDTWNALVPNDVPKLYICFSNGFRTADEVNKYIDDNGGFDECFTVNRFADGFEGSDEERRAYAVDKMLEEVAKERSEVIDPYIEKLGNCQIKDFPGDHFEYQYRPEECAKIAKEFIDSLD